MSASVANPRHSPLLNFTRNRIVNRCLNYNERGPVASPLSPLFFQDYSSYSMIRNSGNKWTSDELLNKSNERCIVTLSYIL